MPLQDRLPQQPVRVRRGFDGIGLVFVPYENAVKDVDLGSYNFTTTGLGTFGNLDVDTLNFNGNVISDSTGAISFADENLTTTGLVTAGNLDVDTLNLNGNVISDSTGAISFDNENLTTTGTGTFGGVVTITGIADGGMTSYDLKVGDTTTPDYGMIQIGNAVIGRTSYNVANMDIDGAIVFRNMGTPATSKIEFVFTESGGDAIRFALAKSGVGNATYNPRSMLIAGPAVLNDEVVTVAYWQTNHSIFDNLACDTVGSGADLGVQNDLEVEGDIFVDSIKESTTSAGTTFHDDILLAASEFLVFDKASGNGSKVDTATPTFGWRDLLGQPTALNVGASKPTFATYRDTLLQFQFGVGDEEYFEFHIPHDYVAGTHLHLHFHWSHTGALVTGGTITWEYEITYAKGHNQAAFPASVTGTVAGTASTTQYQHILSEGQISAGTPAGSQIDSDDLEPDGVILMRIKMQANNMTVSGGGVPDPFLHYADMHYQSTNISTKDKAPDFYA